MSGILNTCCCSAAKSCLTLCDLMDRSTPGLPVPHRLPEFAQVHVHWISDFIQPSSHLTLWHPLFLLPSIFPNIRDFSNELTVRVRWPKYWSLNFSISPSKEYSGLLSIKIDWFDLQGTSRSLLQHHSSKASILWHSAFFTTEDSIAHQSVQSLSCVWLFATPWLQHAMMESMPVHY